MEHVFSDTVACSFLPDSPGASGSCLGASLCVFVEDRPADATDQWKLTSSASGDYRSGIKAAGGVEFSFQAFNAGFRVVTLLHCPNMAFTVFLLTPDALF